MYFKVEHLLVIHLQTLSMPAAVVGASLEGAVLSIPSLQALAFALWSTEAVLVTSGGATYSRDQKSYVKHNGRILIS